MNVFYLKSILQKILLLLLATVIMVSAGAQELNDDPLRSQFKEILQRNPNYFGTMEDTTGKYKSVYVMSLNTKYEELKCVGLYPDQDLLEAVFEVKLKYGFGGYLCQDGTKEYVAFYIDYGSGFVSIGAPEEVSVHDLSFINGGHVYYAARKSFTPPELLDCSQPHIVKVRAILSWEVQPTGPSFIPVWGNVKDVWVQIKPKEYLIMYPLIPQELYPYQIMSTPQDIKKYDLDKESLLFPEKSIFIGDPLVIKDYIENSLDAEKRIKANKNVEEERFDYKKIIKKNPNYFGSLFTKKNQKDIPKSLNIDSELAQPLFPEWIENIELYEPVLTYLLKTKYEELTCVGLYPEQDLLEAILTVKKPYGYNGDLCTLGSKEYVVFYIDWGDGMGYQYVATTAVKVHDIPGTAEKPLHYAVRAVIPNIDTKLKTCSTENIVKVKAILSWEFDPTAFGPGFTPTWGNYVERNIQIRPKDSVQCSINIINLIHVDEISQFGPDKGYAIKTDYKDDFVPGVFDRPFGGFIACWGNVNIPGAQYYRFRYSDNNGASWHNITDSRKTKDVFMWSPVKTVTPDSDGWFSISDYQNDILTYSLAALVHWYSVGKDGDYLIQLQLGTFSFIGIIPIPGQEDTVAIKLDNQAPELFEFGGSPAPTLPTEGVAVKDIAGNYRECGMFTGTELIKIFGNFKDEHFRGYSLTAFGGNLNVSGEPIPTLTFGDGRKRYDSGIPGIGTKGVTGGFNGGPGVNIGDLDLCIIPHDAGPKVECAYGIRLWLSDRTIRGTISGYTYSAYSHYGRNAYISFNWDPAGCP